MTLEAEVSAGDADSSADAFGCNECGGCESLHSQTQMTGFGCIDQLYMYILYFYYERNATV